MAEFVCGQSDRTRASDSLPAHLNGSRTVLY
jgi:hypothetical protein